MWIVWEWNVNMNVHSYYMHMWFHITARHSTSRESLQTHLHVCCIWTMIVFENCHTDSLYALTYNSVVEVQMCICLLIIDVDSQPDIGSWMYGNKLELENCIYVQAIVTVDRHWHWENIYFHLYYFLFNSAALYEWKRK